MIWLAALGGAGPISSTGSAIATVTIDSVSFELYYGLNGSVNVYSFVATSEATSFSGDIKAFFTYLSTSQGFPTSQYLLSIGAGTEPFTGKLLSGIEQETSLTTQRLECRPYNLSLQHRDQLSVEFDDISIRDHWITSCTYLVSIVHSPKAALCLVECPASHSSNTLKSRLLWERFPPYP